MNYIAILDHTYYIRNRIKELMQEMNAELLEASTKKQMLTLLNMHKDVDLILLEIDLPDEEDGFQVMKEIRALRNDVPVIILSSENKRSTFIRGIQEGASDYILKPFQDDFLMQRIEEHLKRKRITVPSNVKKEKEPNLSVDFQKYLELELKKARKGKYEVTLLISLFFKNVDEVTSSVETEYQKISKLLLPHLKKIIFETDLFMPYGSQSFIGIFPFCSVENQHFIKDKFRDTFEDMQIEHPFLESYSLINVFVSFPEDGDNKEDVLKKLSELTLKQVKEYQIRLTEGPLKSGIKMA